MDSLDICDVYAGAPVLGLGKTSLLVFPASDTYAKTGRVVQVTVESAEYIYASFTVRKRGLLTLTDGNHRNGIESDTIAAFFLVQHQVSELVVSTLRAHLTHPLPTPVKFVQHEGAAPYALTAENRAWPYGATLGLMWGDERLVPSDVKWTFKFCILS